MANHDKLSVRSQRLGNLRQPFLVYSFIFSFFIHPLSLLPLPPVLKGVRPDINGESEGRAALVGALVAEERVDGHHLQVQRVFPGPGHGSGQHQHGADVVDLLEKMENRVYSHSQQVRYDRLTFKSR